MREGAPRKFIHEVTVSPTVDHNKQEDAALYIGAGSAPTISG